MPLSHPRNIERLELCLRDLYSWLTANKLKLNSSKTELLQITPLNKPPVELSLTVNGNIIKCSDQVKDLGVLLDSKLTMVDNIQSVTRKAYYALMYTYMYHFIPKYNDLSVILLCRLNLLFLYVLVNIIACV